MSESEKQQDGPIPITNPFCTGEWVALSPSGENPPTMIRRQAIVAVQRLAPLLPNATRKHGVKITVGGAEPGASLFEVNFLHPEYGARDADLLMQACLRRWTNPFRYSVSKHNLGTIARIVLGQGTGDDLHFTFEKQVAARLLKAEAFEVVIP